MNKGIFIPKKIKVGFLEREGTYNGKIAYVIYYDNKGVLRKEKSWESWRDDKIPAKEFDNTPQSGFCLNKNIKRFNWGHFGSNNSYIRIYDPRDIEFEITPENLMGILTETNCLKRGLEGNFVYAWKGTELIVLPCGSEEYKKAVNYTELQDLNIPASDLKPGCSYTTKNNEEVVYLGRLPWHDYIFFERYNKKVDKKKAHVFYHLKEPQYGGKFFKKDDAKYVSILNSPDTISNYADIIDEWKADRRSSKIDIDKWEFIPLNLTEEELFVENGGTEMSDKMIRSFVTRKEDFITVYHACCYPKQSVDVCYISTGPTINIKTLEKTYPPSSYSYSILTGPIAEQITKKRLLDRVNKSFLVNAHFENGKKIDMTTIY